MTQSIMGGWVGGVTGSGSVGASVSRGTQEVVWLDGGRNLAKWGRPWWGKFESSEAARAKGWPVGAAACISVCPRNWLLFSPPGRPEQTDLREGLTGQERRVLLTGWFKASELLVLAARWPGHEDRAPWPHPQGQSGNSATPATRGNSAVR